jgi:DNA-binding CsgD family transcriptional regulator
MRDRRTECEALDRLLDDVRAGRSGALVVRGEAGVGKSALLEYVADRASGCRLARAVGVQSEMELAFAGLHQLCAPMLDHLERLPGPQHDALDIAFGLAAGDAPDRFLVGLAVLTLLAEVAADCPLICLVDDAQWLDHASAQTLGFVARRLLAESVGLVFAAREPNEELELVGLPELVVEGLDDREARVLLDSVVTGPLDESVRDRIVAETRGNPLALLELPRGLTPAELAGGFGLPDAPALSGRIEESFRRRLMALPAQTQRLLLVAAAEPVGDPVLVWNAAQRLGIGVEAAAAAEEAGLCEFGGLVRFRHSLVRSAVYQAASPLQRQSAHAVLAEATDPEADPDRRAWHRAQAAVGPDEDVAQELERSADRAQSRGGLAAAAAFLERAAGLTLEPARRAERALAAAQAKVRAGAPAAARDLLATIHAGRLSELQRARIDLLEGQIAFVSKRGRDAPPLLLNAAKRLEPLDLTLARETYLDAFSAAIFAGRLASDGGSLMDVAQTARAAGWADSSPQPPRANSLLVDGLAVLMTEGYGAGTPVLQRALSACRRERLRGDQEIRLWVACRVAVGVWDDESWHVLSARQVRLAREAGALAVLPIALTLRAAMQILAGEFGAAEALNDEACGVSAAVGNPDPPYARLMLAGWRGREAETSHLIETVARDAAARGEGRVLSAAEYVTAVLYNGLGRYELALNAAQETWEHDDLGFANLTMTELVEAAARRGELDLATAALMRVRERAGASGTEWGLGIEARSRALLSEGSAAEDLYREAIDRLGRSRIRTELARAHLLYGEWLRREHRRTDARDELRTAHEMLAAMGAGAFAERAARELLATGETVRKRTVETVDQFTAQEALIARLARDGLSNPEIGSQLFISPRTVEYHLGKVFTKLDISSRKELRNALPDAERAAVPG